MVRLRVKEIAKEKGFSQGRLSRVADVDIKTISKIFQEHNPDIRVSTLVKLADALGVSPCDLFTRE